MNILKVYAEFTIPTKEAVNLKFENRLDNIVKHHLAKKLVFEIIENNLLDIQAIDSKPSNYSYGHITTFRTTLLVCKQDLCDN